MTAMTCAQAIEKALYDAMKEDQNVMVMGLGVNDPKHVFGTTADLVENFGTDRAIETPCSEAAMTGVAIGAALMGKRPVLVHQRVEFALLSMEQIINNAAKIDYITCGKHSCPIVIRLIIGRGWGQGPTHSQSLEVLFAHIPGLTVLVPYDANSHYHLMREAIRLNEPVIFFEHRWLHGMKGKIHDRKGEYSFRPKVIKPGCDITLVSWGYGVHEALRVATALEAGGISVEVVAVQSLNPLLTGAIVESSIKTGRILIIETGPVPFGISAELVCHIARPLLKVRRIGATNFIPSTRSKIEYAYPSVHSICVVALSMLDKLHTVEANKITTACHEMLDKTPSDVPDNSFTGPF